MLTGRCGCGAVTYRMKRPPMFVHCCHCTECQRQTGSAFVLNGLIEADCVEVEGAMTEVEVPSPSGKGQMIARCADCGVAVYSCYLIRGRQMLFVRLGTLDDPSACPPDVHIFTDSKQPWLDLPKDVPSFPDFYDYNQLWPEEALARRRALFGS